MENSKLNIRMLAILVALVIVTGAVWHTQSSKRATEDAPLTPAATEEGNVPDLEPTDHIRGNPDAPILIVVYSDFGCPYCKEFHGTMKRLMNLYGQSGRVAWVYRHMPLTKLHPESATYALASECVAQQANNAAFWKYIDTLYDEITPEQKLSSEQLTVHAEEVGVPRDAFVSCMSTSNLMTRVEEDFNEALASGAMETPYVVIITPYEQLAQSGAIEFAAFGGIIKTMLRVLGEDSGLQSDEAMPNFFDEMSDLSGDPTASTSASTTPQAATSTES